MTPRLFRSLLAALLFPFAASALGPHELLLLVNANSPRSVELANRYAALRGVPAINIVHLDVPASAWDAEGRITRLDFTRAIWGPAQLALRERRIGDHILAWVYSSDFPAVVTGESEVSLTGLTWTRNELPDAETIKKGGWTSRLFAGPGPDLQRRGASRSLEHYAMFLLTNMPLPAMVLAHTGSRGETLEQAVSRLAAGARMDGVPPAGAVYFLTSDDVRTSCRAWQFADAVSELKGLGQTARILPLGEADRTLAPAWGLMAGTAKPDPQALPRLVPGSVAEHLTSFGALFSGHDYQTKLTAWLRAGAAGSAGTVTEPYSVWTKFPAARIFVHYASGCTLLESFAQAVACPLQLICYGDPLLAPWAKPQGITLIDLADTKGPVRGPVEFAASAWGAPSPDSRIFFLLDGRSILSSGTPPTVRINTAQLPDGYHELRAIAYAGGNVRHQGFATKGFITANRERSLAVIDPAATAEVELGRTLEFVVEVRPAPVEVALVRHESLLASQPGTQGVYRLDTALLGVGPHQVQLAARYEDGEVVRSAPRPLTVLRPQPAPTPDAQTLKLEGLADDGTLTLQSGGTNPVFAVDAAYAGSAEVLEVIAKIPQEGAPHPRQYAGLIFAHVDANNYGYLAWRGAGATWELGKVTDGVRKREGLLAATLEPGKPYLLRLVQGADGVRAEVDGYPVGAASALELKGPFGVAAGADPIVFAQPARK